MTMIDTPEGIAYVRFLARRGRLQMGGRGTKRLIEICREVYNFPGTTRKEILRDMDEYVASKDRLRDVPDEYVPVVSKLTQELTDKLNEKGILSQDEFERQVKRQLDAGAISNGIALAMSDLFYTTIIETNGGTR